MQILFKNHINAERALERKNLCLHGTSYLPTLMCYLPMTLGIFEKTSSILTVDYLLNSCAIKTAYDSAVDIVMRILSYVTEKQTKRNRNRANNLCQ